MSVQLQGLGFMDREEVDEEEEEWKTSWRERHGRPTICGQSSDAKDNAWMKQIKNPNATTGAATIMHSTNPVGFAMGME